MLYNLIITNPKPNRPSWEERGWLSLAAAQHRAQYLSYWDYLVEIKEVKDVLDGS